MEKTLHFALPAKVLNISWGFSFTVSRQTFFVVIYFCGRKQFFHWLNLSKSSPKYTHKYLYFKW